MSSFTESVICKSRKSCWSCRANPEWRAAVGAPEVCPFGIKSYPVGAVSTSTSTPVETTELPPAPSRTPELLGAPLLREVEAREADCRSRPCYRGHCSKCGCGRSMTTPWKDLRICPVRHWTSISG